MRKETAVLLGIGLVTLIIIVGAAFFLSSPITQQPAEKVSDMTLLLGTKDHMIGTESATVTVVEFADFQCPACGAAFPIVKQLTEEYKDRIQYVFRHFPLPGHKNARPAALAAEAAGMQGKFFEMHDKLFSTQADWSESNNPEEIFTGYAQELELDMEKYAADVKDPATNQKVEKGVTDGIQAGVNSTPTFYINGEKYTGVLSYDNFKSLLDEKLKGK